MSGKQAGPLPVWARTLTFLTLAWGIASLPFCMPAGCMYNRVTIPYRIPEEFSTAPWWYVVLMLCFFVGSLVTAVSAIVGGVLLWARRPIARQLLTAFAWAAISVGVGSTGVLFLGLIHSGEDVEGWIFPLIAATVGLSWNGAIAVYVLVTVRRAEVREDFRQWAYAILEKMAEGRSSNTDTTRTP